MSDKPTKRLYISLGPKEGNRFILIGPLSPETPTASLFHGVHGTNWMIMEMFDDNPVLTAKTNEVVSLDNGMTVKKL